MYGKREMKLLIFGGLLMGAAAFVGNHCTADAAEYPAYTISKGKKVTISNIINKNPLTVEKKNEYKNLTWKSGNKKIVQVIGNKKIKGIKKGKAFIRGYDSNKKKVLAIRVTVGKKVSKITAAAEKKVLNVGDTTKITVSVAPKTASNKQVFFTSSDPAVATVTKKGKITATASGSAVITVTSKDGSKKKKVSIKVQSELIRTTSKGKVKGIEDANGKVLVWYGIPYGASTAGKNRWRAPQPVAAWSGTLNAIAAKEGAAQYSDGTSYIGTEDCLYVNVYRPNNGKKNLPVMVYLHGGGNAGGNSNESFSGMAAATNAIVVTVEYRVGAFGYLSHEALRDGTDEENSGNFALLDIKASLTWVRDEIANFGGNPGNVTLSGFSAGARNAMLCLISPSMKGLFHKAIIFSGGCTTCTNEEGEESANDKLAAILVKRGTYATKAAALEYIQLASKSEVRSLFDSLTTTEVANMYRSSGLRLGKFPQCFVDGVVVPKEGFDVIASGNYNRVPVIFGSDATEFSSFAWSGSLTSELGELEGITSANQMINLVVNGIKYGSMLQSGFYVEKPAELLSRDPAHAAIYAYRFKWGTNADVTDGFYSKFVGAFHGAGKDFLRGFYRNSYVDFSPNAISTNNKPGRMDLTSVMQKYIGNFLATGNPNDSSLANWGTWNNVAGAQKIMNFDASATKSTSKMSTEYYEESATFAQMKASLTKSEYNILVKSLFADRFFMPGNVPEY